MNPFAQMVDCLSNLPPPTPKEPAPKVIAGHTFRPCVARYGRQIDARYTAGEKLVDIAKDMGLAYSGVRGMYSTYRKYRRLGLLSD